LATALQYVTEVTVEQPRETRSVRNMARLFFACFWTILFTGAVRKWMFPGTSALYLLQDVPIGIAYVYALWTGLFARTYLMLGIVVLSVVIMLQAALQIIVPGLPPFIAFVGLHNYLFYLPMLFIFPLCLTEHFRKNFIWWNLIGSLPMCLLAIAQAKSPPQAWVNRTSQGDAFGVSGSEIARVSGTFNFGSFFGLWVALAVGLCMGEWLLPKHRRAIKRTWLMVLCTVAANLCHLVSGSRGAIALAGLAILGAMVAAIVLGSTRAILAIGGICVLMPVVAAMTYVISPAEFNIVSERFTGDEYVADSKNRALEGFIGFATEPKFSLIGAGVGMGVDASHVGNADAYNFTYQLSETDIIRTVMELGTPVGLSYALIRICFALGMIFIAVQVVRRGSSPHVLPISFFCFFQMYQADLTRNATMTCSQVMVCYSFILGAYYYPDNTSLELEADDSLTRSA
jgi:hypothetical protein